MAKKSRPLNPPLRTTVLRGDNDEVWLIVHPHRLVAGLERPQVVQVDPEVAERVIRRLIAIPPGSEIEVANPDALKLMIEPRDPA
jgi:hypothetical protein